jgi:serine/threonine protein kinase
MTKAKRDQAWVEICEEIQKAVNSRAEVREPLDEPPPRQAKQPGLITDTDTAVAAEVLAGPELLAATEMSTLFVGSLSPHGKVVMKIVHESLPESEEWIASPPYKIAIGDRFLMDGTTKDGARYLVFQFIDGVSLGKVVRPGNVIRGALLDEIIMQLMRQLSVFNNASNQAVHRDVTPDNLLLTMEAAGPVVRLIDYESGCFSTASQNPVRNFGFTAPEQEIGRAIPSSDLYSLVSTVYFLATGEVTLRSGPSPPEFPAGTFGSLTEFDERYDFNEFLRCWSTEPEERPTSAAAFLSNTIRRGSRGIKNPVRLGTFACGPNLTFELFDMPKRLVDYLSAKSRSAQSMN